MKMRKVVLVCILSTILGAVMGASVYHLYKSKRQLPFENKWLEVAENGNVVRYTKSVGYTKEAMLADISLPAIKERDAKVKFLRPINGGPNTFSLGYIVTIIVESLDVTKIPQKYRKEKPDPRMPGLIILPVEQVTYKCHIGFLLLDKDGFQLMQLSGPTHLLQSGKTNVFQDLTKEPIQVDVASRTSFIKVKLYMDKCGNCE